jgi:hypothetical protein
MDDESDRAFSRAPELEDLLALCRALRAEGVRYLLIGGFAVIPWLRPYGEGRRLGSSFEAEQPEQLPVVQSLGQIQ